MYQPKVKNTQWYTDSQGEHIVHEGKLVLMKYTLDKEVFVNIEGAYKYPIVVSETEEIEVGDKVLYANSTYDVIRIDEHNRPIVMLEDEEAQLAIWDKVLALPNQLSEKHLQAIVDGKMKDGDDVYVECQVNTTFDLDSIWLDKNNHITLFPAKQSLEEAAIEYSEHLRSMPEFKDVGSEFIEMVYKEGAKWTEK